MIYVKLDTPRYPFKLLKNDNVGQQCEECPPAGMSRGKQWARWQRCDGAAARNYFHAFHKIIFNEQLRIIFPHFSKLFSTSSSELFSRISQNHYFQRAAQQSQFKLWWKNGTQTLPLVILQGKTNSWHLYTTSFEQDEKFGFREKLKIPSWQRMCQLTECTFLEPQIQIRGWRWCGKFCRAVFWRDILQIGGW